MRLRSRLTRCGRGGRVGFISRSGAIGLAFLLWAPNANAEFAFRPDQAAAKLTATAKRLKVSFPFRHKICATTDMTGCAFLAGSVTGMATGPQNGKAERVDLIYPLSDGTPADMPITWGILMALVSPEMTKNDRGALTVRFMRAITEPGFTSLTEQRGAVTYTIALDRELGVRFLAASEAP